VLRTALWVPPSRSNSMKEQKSEPTLGSDFFINMKIENLGIFGLRFIQPDGIPRFGTDSVLLADFAASRLRRGMRVLDLCCGSGILSVLLAGRKHIDLTGVEIDPLASQAARDNLSLNNLHGSIITADLCTLPVEKPYDLVVANPPYFETSGPQSPDYRRNAARSERFCPLSDFVQAASRQVKFGGYMMLCYPPTRLSEVLCAFHEVGLEPKRLRPVAYTPDKSPFILLIEVKKGASPGLIFMPTLYMTGSEVKEIYAGRYGE